MLDIIAHIIKDFGLKGNASSPIEYWLGIKALLVGDSPLVESLCCVFEQDTLAVA